MLKSSLIALSLSAVLNLVLASSVTITSPKPNDVWEAGSTVHIKWDVNDKTSGPIRLQYASGPSKALVINGVIADDVDASAGEYSWKIPADLKQKKYVIEAGPSANDLSFAGYITLKNNASTKTKSVASKKSTKSASKGKEVCVGIPGRGEGAKAKKITCFPVKDLAVKSKKAKTTKHKTTKHKATKIKAAKHKTTKHKTTKKH